MYKNLSTICLLLMAGGCATAAGGGPGSPEYSTYRLVQDMDANVRGALDQLNRTTSEMSLRIDESERTLRELQSIAEENQVKIDQLQQSLDSLTKTLYRHFDLTPPPTRTPMRVPTAPRVESESSSVESGEVLVEPPASTPPPETQTQAPPDETTTMDVDRHYREAQTLYGNGNFNAALTKFAEHVRQFPDSPHAGSAQYWKAHCHFKLNEYQAAIEEFDRLRTTYPNNSKIPTAMHNQAVAFSRLGQTARAEALFRRLIAEYPDDAASESAREMLRQLQGL